MSNLSETVMTSDATLVWFAKIAGAVAGSAVSLAYMLPNGKREAGIRFAVGIVCGMIFGGAAGVKLAETLSLEPLLGRAEVMLMGATAASLAAWSVLGILKRFAERIKHAPLPGLPFSQRSRNDQA